MIIDSHVHFFADKIVVPAREKLISVAQIPTYTDFTEADTRSKLLEWGIDYGVLLPIATKPSQQRTVNDWAASVQHGNIIAFGSVHPGADDALEELERICSLGLHGVKMHPDYQEFFADDENIFPIYEKMSELGLAVCFHTGFDPISPDVIHATPQMIARVSDTFPNLKIIAAHLGGWRCGDDSEKYLAGRNIYMDISMSDNFRTQEEFERIIKKHGPERVLFGSDCPWCMPRSVLDMLKKLGLPNKETELILYKNISRLLELGI